MFFFLSCTERFFGEPKMVLLWHHCKNTLLERFFSECSMLFICIWIINTPNVKCRTCKLFYTIKYFPMYPVNNNIFRIDFSQAS